MTQRPRPAMDRRPPAYPTQSWYVVATTDETTAGTLVARRALNTSLVIYRTDDNSVVVLEDRDAHNPYPLSLGRLDGDNIVSSYSGFAYAPDGRCVHVPTQVEVPYGAQVRAFPVREVDGLIWAWFGTPGVAALRQPPRAPWLTDTQWTTFGDSWITEANFSLLHENFADITHVAVVDPDLAPPVLSGPVPVLDVQVSETSVGYQRDYPPAPLAPWHAALIGADTDAQFSQHEEGRFVSPGMWVDSWVVQTSDHSDATFRFTHAVTPIDLTTTRHIWRVSRNFAAASEYELKDRFGAYYRSVQQILQTMQHVLTVDGPRTDVSVAADAVALHVRRIVARMATDERFA